MQHAEDFFCYALSMCFNMLFKCSWWYAFFSAGEASIVAIGNYLIIHLCSPFMSMWMTFHSKSTLEDPFTSIAS